MPTPVNLTLTLRRIVQGKNPREYFDPDEMAELEEGLRAAGRVIQPIFVRPIPGTDLYEIVAGERRWRAAKNVLGDDYEMPVVIEALTDEQAEAYATIENYHRAAMSHAEEAQAARRTLMRHKGDKHEAAASLGWKPDLLDRRLALLTCTAAVLSALTQRQIQLGHAELLAGVPPEKQDCVLAGIIAHKVPVNVLKEQLGRFARRLADAIFDTAQCAACPHNSSRQSGLFDESLGDGFCQHPTHYDELTLLAVEAKASALATQYPVVHIIRASDGFSMLPVSEDGAVGVGPEQYSACQGCASFGCSVSSLPGSQGEVTTSLCFDAECNSRHVATWSKVQREAREPDNGKADDCKADTSAHSSCGAAGRSGKDGKGATKAANKTPQRVVDYRVGQWRKWAAKELMMQPERNRRVLIALAQAGRTGDIRSTEFAQAAGRIAQPLKSSGFERLLGEGVDIDAQHLERLVLAVTASAAFGVNVGDLQAVLNFLEVDECKHFKWSAEFLELFTMSELESLASATGLKKRVGDGFKQVRAKKKGEFIQALLTVPGFSYAEVVPAVMRYPRRRAPWVRLH